MARAEAQSLRASIGGSAEQFLFDRNARARYGDLANGTSLGGRLDELAGKSVLVAAGSQLTTALALIELDGLARRLAILPPDADPDHFAAIIAGARDRGRRARPQLGGKPGVRFRRCLARRLYRRDRRGRAARRRPRATPNGSC